MTEQQRRLYRSQTNKVFAGVCGGLAEYLDVDATIIRIVWVLLTLLGGSGIILYIVAFFIVPERPMTISGSPAQIKSKSGSTSVFGIIFVIVGAVLLLDNLEVFSFCRIWDTTWEILFPGILVLLGIYLMTRRGKIQTTPSEQTTGAAPELSAESQTPPPAASTENTTNYKVFRRSLNDRKVFGLCGGAGEYFGIDSTILRVAYAIFTVLSGGMGIILYLLMYLIVPEDQRQQNKQ
jgi:phage shock protein C